MKNTKDRYEVYKQYGADWVVSDRALGVVVVYHGKHPEAEMAARKECKRLNDLWREGGEQWPQWLPGEVAPWFRND